MATNSNSGRFALRDLPKNFERILTPPERFRDTRPGTYGVVAGTATTSTDDYEDRTDCLFTLRSNRPGKTNNGRITSPTQYRNFPISPTLGVPIPSTSNPRPLSPQCPAGPSNGASSQFTAPAGFQSSITTVCSQCNSSECRGTEEDESMSLTTSFKDQEKLKLEKVKARQISDLLNDCQKYCHHSVKVHSPDVRPVPKKSLTQKSEYGNPKRVVPPSLNSSLNYGATGSFSGYLPIQRIRKDVGTETDEEMWNSLSKSMSFVISKSQGIETEPSTLIPDVDDDDALNTRNESVSEIDGANTSVVESSVVNNVVVVGVALSQVCMSPTRQFSVQTEPPTHSPVSVQTVTTEKETTDAVSQTKIHYAAMDQLLKFPSPPLNMDIYTQTQIQYDSQSVFSPIQPLPVMEYKESKEAQAEIHVPGYLDQSILEGFGRKCTSMHNISDWNSNKFVYLSSSDGNSYRRNLSHAEAMLYTVMCQDNFRSDKISTIYAHSTEETFEKSSVTALDEIPKKSTPGKHQKEEAVTYFVESPDGSTDTDSSSRGSIAVVSSDEDIPEDESFQEDEEIVTQTETTDDEEPENSESLCSLVSAATATSEEVPDEGPDYDADDEFSSTEIEEIEQEEELTNVSENSQPHHPRPPPLSSRSPPPGTYDPPPPAPGPPALVAQVLPQLTGAVIKRIIKRGKLKATMSDYS